GGEAGIGGLPAEADAEAAAHRRSVVRRPERNVRVRSLRRPLTVLVCDANVVDAERAAPPHLVDLLVELLEFDSAVPLVPLWLAGIERFGSGCRIRPLLAGLGEARQNFLEDEPDVAAHLPVLVRHAVPEFAVLVPVRLAHVGEVVDVAGRDLREVERVLAGVEAERDDDVVLAKASPHLHRALVATEADVAESVLV